MLFGQINWGIKELFNEIESKQEQIKTELHEVWERYPLIIHRLIDI